MRTLKTHHQSSATELVVEYRHYWIEGLRIFLGVLIFLRGFYYVENLPQIYLMMEQAFPVSPFIVAHIVVAVHLVGGILLALGLFTRAASLVQIPILAGTIFMAHGLTVLGRSTELEFALLVVALLIVFFFYGGGKWSVDHHLMRRKEADF